MRLVVDVAELKVLTGAVSSCHQLVSIFAFSHLVNKQNHLGVYCIHKLFYRIQLGENNYNACMVYSSDTVF